MCNKIEHPSCWLTNSLSCTGVSLNPSSPTFLVQTFIDQICSNLRFLSDLLLILKMSPKIHPQKPPPTAPQHSQRHRSQGFTSALPPAPLLHFKAGFCLYGAQGFHSLPEGRGFDLHLQMGSGREDKRVHNTVNVQGPRRLWLTHLFSS